MVCYSLKDNHVFYKLLNYIYMCVCRRDRMKAIIKIIRIKNSQSPTKAQAEENYSKLTKVKTNLFNKIYIMKSSIFELRTTTRENNMLPLNLHPILMLFNFGKLGVWDIVVPYLYKNKTIITDLYILVGSLSIWNAYQQKKYI